MLSFKLHFKSVPSGENGEDVLGHPVMHLSALKQATGEAVYCDDIPCYENELHLALVTSTEAHALIRLIKSTHFYIYTEWFGIQ